MTRLVVNTGLLSGPCTDPDNLNFDAGCFEIEVLQLLAQGFEHFGRNHRLLNGLGFGAIKMLALAQVLVAESTGEVTVNDADVADMVN